MINTVIKRDGREKCFNPKNIRSALEKAFVSVDGAVNDDAEIIINRIINQITDLNKAKISVEEIQNMIENKLMQSSRKDVAKAYILYREQRTRIRDFAAGLNNDMVEGNYSENDYAENTYEGNQKPEGATNYNIYRGHEYRVKLYVTKSRDEWGRSANPASRTINIGGEELTITGKVTASPIK